MSSRFLAEYISSGGARYYVGSDITDGAWTTESGGTTLYASIDEPAVANDADYIQSAVRPIADTCEIKFAGVLWNGDTVAHTLRYRAWGRRAPLVAKLMCGAVEIAAWTHTSVGAPATYARALTSGQVAAITACTDPTDLRLRLIAS